MSDHEAKVRAAFVRQADWCEQLGSSFTARLCTTLAEHLDKNSAVGRLILDWPGQPDSNGDAVPLRLAGGLHALVRAGKDPFLAALYPPAALAPAGELWNAVAASLLEHEVFLLGWMTSAPQTNEVSRAAILYAGLCEIVAAYGLPLALYEVGSSAGLNLNLDRFGYSFDGTLYGNLSAALRFEPDWRGNLPPQVGVSIAARCGVDLNPLNAASDKDCERLMAYLWADQPSRLERMEKALAIARGHPLQIDKGDAAPWLENKLTGGVLDKTCRVLMHSIAFQYFPDQSKRRINEVMAQAGARATCEKPLVWLAFEVDPAFDGTPSLKIKLWPGGKERLLARGSPHGYWIEWLAS